MSLEKLAAYKLDPAYIDVHTITLDDAPDVEFQVVLPSAHNRAYMAEVYAGVHLEVRNTDEDSEKGTGGEGDVSIVRAKTSVLETRDRQEKGFMKHCLKSMDGAPVPPNFAQEYPAAVIELMTKANAILSELQAEESDAAKKSAPTSSGNIAGVIG